MASTGRLVGNAITALPPPSETPAESTVTVRKPGDLSASRATSGVATSGPGDRPDGWMRKEVPLTGITRSEGAR